jgi:hypothetical protein
VRATKLRGGSLLAPRRQDFTNPVLDDLHIITKHMRMNFATVAADSALQDDLKHHPECSLITMGGNDLTQTDHLCMSVETRHHIPQICTKNNVRTVQWGPSKNGARHARTFATFVQH